MLIQKLYEDTPGFPTTEHQSEFVSPEALYLSRRGVFSETSQALVFRAISLAFQTEADVI